MLFEESYKTPLHKSEAKIVERSSVFWGILFPVQNMEDVKRSLQSLKQQYPDASHHCYAYVLGIDKSAQFSTDGGEPSGTAGRPILKQILSYNLTNVLIVVVRYFGGKLLGVPGLIEAYGRTAAECLQQVKIHEKTIESYYKVSFSYEDEADVWQLARQSMARIDEQNYDEKGCLVLAIPSKLSDKFESMAEAFYKLEVAFLKTG